MGGAVDRFYLGYDGRLFYHEHKKVNHEGSVAGYDKYHYFNIVA